MKHILGAVLAGVVGVLSIQAAQATELRQVKLAEVIRSQFYVPMYVAITNGYVAEEGLEVEMITANGGDRVGALLLSGGADFGLSGPEVPIYIYNGESPDKPRIFSALTATDGFYLVSRDPVEDFDWSMLNGTSILGWRPGSTPQLYLEYVLKKHEIDAATIDGVITNIGPQARDGAWLSGTGEFGIFTEPSLSRLESEGDVHVIASIGTEVGRADYTVFFAQESWLEENGDVAQSWTNAISKAQNWMETASDAEIATALAPFFPGMTEEDNLSVVQRYRNNAEPIWAENTLVSTEGLSKVQEIMTIGGVLPADEQVDYDTIVDTSYSDRAEAATN